MRSVPICLLLVGFLGSSGITLKGLGQDLEKAPDGTKLSRQQSLARLISERDPDFKVWKQKAELELEVLQAQVKAKKAEIRRREAEYRAKQLAPDLAILTKLDMTPSMSFPEYETLENVLIYVKNQTRGPNDSGMAIYVDPDGLKKVNKTMQSPVSIDLDGFPLRTTLRLVLKQLSLAYTVKDGLLKIGAESCD